MSTVLFNPYTGTPRHPSDIQSDPQGLLIVDPEATGSPAAAQVQIPRDDISLVLLERLSRTLTRLGYATPEGGMEHFNAVLPHQLYNLCRGIDGVLDKIATPIPQQVAEPATPRLHTSFWAPQEAKINVGTIGHIDPDKATLTAAISTVLAAAPQPKETK